MLDIILAAAVVQTLAQHLAVPGTEHADIKLLSSTRHGAEETPQRAATVEQNAYTPNIPHDKTHARAPNTADAGCAKPHMPCWATQQSKCVISNKQSMICRLQTHTHTSLHGPPR